MIAEINRWFRADDCMVYEEMRRCLNCGEVIRMKNTKAALLHLGHHFGPVTFLSFGEWLRIKLHLL